MSDLRHDIKAITKFLELLNPGGPWMLSAIQPDKPGLIGATFTYKTMSDMISWLNAHAPNKNIYYHVNRSDKEIKTKAEEKEISEVCYLHVDIDPRVGEDVTEEKERIKKLVLNPPEDIPKPTLVISSGGGFNALWRLDEPFRTDGALEQIEKIKAYNRQLEFRLGGDHCHNIDRILRLPGTVNWPDSKKRAKGRVPTLAELVVDNKSSYPLSSFVAAQPVQEKKSEFSNPQRVKVSGNVRRLSPELDELGPHIGDTIKKVIIEGVDPDDAGRFQSRSEAIFWVCCHLIRNGIDDETIFSIITDPSFKISSSVLDKGSRAHKYAIRQIERAKEDAIAPELRELNERHAVVENYGGKCRVIEELNDADFGRSILTQQSFEDFRNRYMHRKIQVGENKEGQPIMRELGKWWLENQLRRQFKTIIFAPGREVENAYNLWRGFSFEAEPGHDHEPWLDHVRKHICNGNEEHYEYLVNWMARCVQKPDCPGEVAVVMRGRMGVGKGVFVRTFGGLFGRHFLAVGDSKHVVGSFNAHLWDCVVLFSDEAFWAGDPRQRSMLKTLITEETIMVEGKHQNAVSSRNCVHLLLATNDDWAVPAGADERRFLVLDVSPARIQDTEYFKQLGNQMKAGGSKHLLHYLLTKDISSFEVRKAPQTEALLEQKIHSFTSEEEWWYRKLVDGILIDGHPTWEMPVPKASIIDDYLTYAHKVGVNRRATETVLGRFLTKVCTNGVCGLRRRQMSRDVRAEEGRLKKDRPYFYEFPPLETCRNIWNELHGGGFQWPRVEIMKDDHPNAPPNQEHF